MNLGPASLATVTSSSPGRSAGVSAIERRGDLRRLLALLAGRSGGILVPAALAGESGRRSGSQLSRDCPVISPASAIGGFVPFFPPDRQSGVWGQRGEL